MKSGKAPYPYEAHAAKPKLADNVIEPGLRVAVARRQLKQKTSHAIAEDIGDHAKIRMSVFVPLNLLM